LVLVEVVLPLVRTQAVTALIRCFQPLHQQAVVEADHQTITTHVTAHLVVVGELQQGVDQQLAALELQTKDLKVVIVQQMMLALLAVVDLVAQGLIL
jgi:hypothetical protein